MQLGLLNLKKKKINKKSPIQNLLLKWNLTLVNTKIYIRVGVCISLKYNISWTFSVEELEMHYISIPGCLSFLNALPQKQLTVFSTNW